MTWLRKLFIRGADEPLPSLIREARILDTERRNAAAREKFLAERLADMAAEESVRESSRAFESMVGELVEARALAGAGPWRVGPEALRTTDQLIHSLRERVPLREDFTNTQGAYGDIELALQNVDWRREVNFSVLQFSRWGIQQIILICRLYWLKNPIVRRLINVVAAYVFARGVEITTNDDVANEVLSEFFARNRSVFGQVALVQAQRGKATDGNLFWAFFPDLNNSGSVSARWIDATEISEIVSNPDDSEEPWYYLRIWVQSQFDPLTGQTSNGTRHAWYPAMGYDPPQKPETMRGFPVVWESCVYHRKCGYVGKWNFGCPEAYPMMDWAKESRRYLEACASVAQQLAQVALTLTTKGGQQAMMGAKQQLGTTEGPSAALWDQNPPAVAGGVFASGTGTKLEAFKTQGAGVDPKGADAYIRMCCITMGVPETFASILGNSNLATATSLDRPTETMMMEKQEEWREDLSNIAQFVLRTSAAAPRGRLSESRGMGQGIRIVESRRTIGATGSVAYEAPQKRLDAIEVKVVFPAIREGDMPARIAAIVESMTLGNKAGLIIGIDEKVGVQQLYEELGVENGDAIAEEQYPSTSVDGHPPYDANRNEEVLPPPIQRPKPQGGIQPAPDDVPDERADAPVAAGKQTERALRRVQRAITALLEAGHAK